MHGEVREGRIGGQLAARVRIGAVGAQLIVERRRARLLPRQPPVAAVFLRTDQGAGKQIERDGRRVRRVIGENGAGVRAPEIVGLIGSEKVRVGA
jgi:hypothetical protein